MSLGMMSGYLDRIATAVEALAQALAGPQAPPVCPPAHHVERQRTDDGLVLECLSCAETLRLTTLEPPEHWRRALAVFRVHHPMHAHHVIFDAVAGQERLTCVPCKAGVVRRPDQHWLTWGPAMEQFLLAHPLGTSAQEGAHDC